MKRIIVLAFFIFLGTYASYAQQPEIFTTSGKAIKGYDPVAFFTVSKPVKGYDSLSVEWKNATWLFSDSKNLKAFKANPEKYAPQYGGYCAYGMSQGHKSPTETETWTVLDEKLYFNYNKKVQEMWSKNQPALIEKADKQWPALKNN